MSTSLQPSLSSQATIDPIGRNAGISGFNPRSKTSLETPETDSSAETPPTSTKHPRHRFVRRRAALDRFDNAATRKHIGQGSHSRTPTDHMTCRRPPQIQPPATISSRTRTHVRTSHAHLVLVLVFMSLVLCLRSLNYFCFRAPSSGAQSPSRQSPSGGLGVLTLLARKTLRAKRSYPANALSRSSMGCTASCRVDVNSSSICAEAQERRRPRWLFSGSVVAGKPTRGLRVRKVEQVSR